MPEKPEKNDNPTTGNQGGIQIVGPELPTQKSIDLLTMLLQELERRYSTNNASNLPPEVERDIAVVGAAFDSIESALALAESPMVISTIAPGSGPAGGGTNVTITGSHFLPGATVHFGNSAATNVTVVSLREIRATTPAGPVGPADVFINTLAGSAASGGFSYQP
jgi:IPT/TIG domain